MDEQNRYCWVCLGSESDEPSASWVHPCKCRGTTKWVHQHCLQKWVDEKQRGNIMAKVNCSACGVEYLIYYPSAGFVLNLLERIDSFIFKASPYLTGTIVVGSIYWTAVTYGAVTVMQVLGHKDGLGFMEHTDPLTLLVGLPIIPVTLIICRMIRWEEYVLNLWRKIAFKFPVFRPIEYSEIPQWRLNIPFEATIPISVSRVLCGALLFPTFATFVGKLFFRKIGSNFQRALLGGLVFVTIKGVLKMHNYQKKYLRICRRKIEDYPEEDSAKFTTSSGGNSIDSANTYLQATF